MDTISWPPAHTASKGPTLSVTVFQFQEPGKELVMGKRRRGSRRIVTRMEDVPSGWLRLADFEKHDRTLHKALSDAPIESVRLCLTDAHFRTGPVFLEPVGAQRVIEERAARTADISQASGISVRVCDSAKQPTVAAGWEETRIRLDELKAEVRELSGLVKQLVCQLT